jgi:transcriptional regulator with XRE-family HTH domain
MSLTHRQLVALRSAPVPPSGNRLKHAMKMLGLTQVVLAERIGVGQPYVSAVVTGRYSTMTLENAARFAAFFGCHIEDLFPPRQRHREVA